MFVSYPSGVWIPKTMHRIWDYLHLLTFLVKGYITFFNLFFTFVCLFSVWYMCLCVCACSHVRICIYTCSTNAEMEVGFLLPLYGFWGSNPDPLGLAASTLTHWAILWTLITSYGFMKVSMTTNKKLNPSLIQHRTHPFPSWLTGNFPETLEPQSFMGLRPQKPRPGMWLTCMATGGRLHLTQLPHLRVQAGDKVLWVLLVRLNQ